MKTNIVRITPAIAKAYLEKNTVNRILRDSAVAYLANEMIAGRWKLTNQGIAFFEDGTLADGQHRLAAIVQSGVTVDILMTTGLSREVMSAIDTGVKRTVADFMHLHEGLENANVVCSIARQVISTFFNYQNYGIPAEVIKFVIEYYKSDIAEVVSATRGFKAAQRGWVQACLVIARHRHPAQIDAFLKNFATGESLRIGDPAHTMREWLICGSATVLKQSYKRGSVETALNILSHQVSGTKYKFPKQGAQGHTYFAQQEKRMIEQVRSEIAHLIKR